MRQVPPQGVITARVASRIRRLRKSKNISSETLVRLMNDRGINWGRTILSNLETGQRASITVDELVVVADALAVEPARLMEPESELDCPRCGGQPTAGFTCNACGTSRPD